VKIDGEGAIALSTAKEAMDGMENYIDNLEGQLKRAVHEVERGEVQKIKANIRIKNLQFRHQEEMLRKHEEMSMRLRDSEQVPLGAAADVISPEPQPHRAPLQVKQTLQAEAKAVIRSLSGKLTGLKHELRAEQLESRAVRRHETHTHTEHKPTTNPLPLTHPGWCVGVGVLESFPC